MPPPSKPFGRAPGCQQLLQLRSASPGLHGMPPRAARAPCAAPLEAEPARPPAPPGTRSQARSAPMSQHVCGRAGTVRPRSLTRPPARSLLRRPPHRRAWLQRLALRRPRSPGGRGPGTLFKVAVWVRPSSPPSRDPPLALLPPPRPLLPSAPPS